MRAREQLLGDLGPHERARPVLPGPCHPRGALLKPAAQVSVHVEYTRGTQGILAEASAEAEWLVEQHSYSMDALEPVTTAPGPYAPMDARGERRVRVVDRGRLIAYFDNGTQQVIPILVLEA